MSVRSVYTVHTIITHPRPHLDELAAIDLLKRRGEERYRGIRQAAIEDFDPSVHLDGRSEEEWLGDGVLFVGVRCGRYDDHPHDRFPDDCAYTLVLKGLGLADDPRFRELARHIRTEDQTGAPHPLHLASLVKALHGHVGTTDILAIVGPCLDALERAQASFLEALAVVRDCNPILVVNQKSGRELLLVAVQNDNKDVSRAARSKEGLNAALVLQQKREDSPAGHVYISGSGRLGVTDFSALAAVLRTAEQEAAGEVLITDPRRLLAEGVLPEVPEWYLFTDAIFNGSLTAPKTPRTRLTFEQMTGLCVAYLRTTRLLPRR